MSPMPPGQEDGRSESLDSPETNKWHSLSMACFPPVSYETRLWSIQTDSTGQEGGFRTLGQLRGVGQLFSYDPPSQEMAGTIAEMRFREAECLAKSCTANQQQSYDQKPGLLILSSTSVLPDLILSSLVPIFSRSYGVYDTKSHPQVISLYAYPRRGFPGGSKNPPAMQETEV